MEAKFSQRVKNVLTYSREEALRLGNDYIGLEHLLLGILRDGEGLAIQVLLYFGIELDKLKRTIEQSIRSADRKQGNLDNIPLVKQAERALKITYLEAKLFNSDLIGTEHLLLAILKDENNIVTRFFHKRGIDYESVKEELKNMLTNDDSIIHPKNELPDETEDMDESRAFSGSAKRFSDTK